MTLLQCKYKQNQITGSLVVQKLGLLFDKIVGFNNRVDNKPVNNAAPYPGTKELK